MNAISSQIDESQSGHSLFGERGSDDSPLDAGQSGSCRDAADPLERLGRLLRGHTWRDSRDWARALDQLSRLSEADLRRVIDGSSDRSRS